MITVILEFNDGEPAQWSVTKTSTTTKQEEVMAAYFTESAEFCSKDGWLELVNQERNKQGQPPYVPFYK